MKRIIFCLVWLPLLASCSYDETLNKFLPKDESAFAIERLEDLRNKRFDALRGTLAQDSITPDIDARLAHVAGFFPEGEPIQIKPIGVNTHKTSTTWQANLTYQYQFERGWAAASIVLQKRELDGLKVKGINVTRLDRPLEEIYAFRLKDKTIAHYVVLALVVAIPLFVLYVLVLCIRTPIKKRKWLWILFILFGVIGFHMNWTTGETAVQLLSIHLFGGAAQKASPYAPWIFTIAFPLGALVFLTKRNSGIAGRLRRGPRLASLDAGGKLVATVISEEPDGEVSYHGEITKQNGQYDLRLVERKAGGEEVVSNVVFESWEELDKYMRAETKLIADDFK